MQAYGQGTVKSHQHGRFAELVFAEFLGVPAEENWSYFDDRERGCDLITIRERDGQEIHWHIRSTRNSRGEMMIRPKDPNSPHDFYVLIDTSKAPVYKVIGWTTKQRVIDNGIPLKGMYVDPTKLVWNVPRSFLTPFPDIFPIAKEPCELA